MRKPKVKASSAQIAVMSLFIGFAIFFFSYPFIQDWSIALASSIFVISVITLHRKQNDEPKETGLYLIGVVKEIQYQKSDQKTGREIKRFELYPRKLDLNDDILSLKGQNNITISGVAGSGKTQLTYFIIEEMKQFKKIIFQFDPQDHYKNLGIPTLFLKRYAPNIFKDPDSFAEAWETAFQGEATTYKAILDIVKKIALKSHNWQDFKKVLDEETERYTHADMITIGAYKSIQRQLQSVYMDNVIDYAIPDNLVISFEGMDIKAFQFYGDWILRTLYKELLQENSPRSGTMLVVDEAQQFRNDEKPVLPSIMALVRKRGALMMGTQFVSDLKHIRGNAKTQFAFYTNEGADLDEIKKISEVYHYAIQALHPYEFNDLAQTDSQVSGIYIYKLFGFNPEFKPVVEWKPNTKEEKKEENSQNERGKGRPDIDIPKEILRLLSQPANQQDLSKRFSKKFGNDPNYWKMTLKSYLKKMTMEGDIASTDTEYVKFSEDKVYPIHQSVVYHRKGDYSYHDWLVGIAADVLYHKGLNPQIQPHGLPLADILIEKPKLAFEIETGSKNGYKIDETKQRIADFQKQGYKVYIIVPNQEVKAKYKDFENVMTALELWEEVKN